VGAPVRPVPGRNRDPTVARTAARNVQRAPPVIEPWEGTATMTIIMLCALAGMIVSVR
jgi:hypothetical protein